ncbi:hypothetical protein [Salipaludibacillus agaradhaerens]|uniref:hypothetical protein n=1 Tax=Salipaludibacillus agaradhaerens TaxID=76935 RepID=UPI00099627E3|nr:hypothetical protein [Salipaludibacillus agaradhaerens]
MEAVGEQIIDIGFLILPISFITFFLLRTLEHLWRKVIASRLVKCIWYLAYGSLNLTGHVSLELLVVFVIFIEAGDLFFDYLNRKRVLKERLEEGELYKKISIS